MNSAWDEKLEVDFWNSSPFDIRGQKIKVKWNDDSSTFPPPPKNKRKSQIISQGEDLSIVRTNTPLHVVLNVQ